MPFHLSTLSNLNLKIPFPSVPLLLLFSPPFLTFLVLVYSSLSTHLFLFPFFTHFLYLLTTFISSLPSPIFLSIFKLIIFLSLPLTIFYNFPISLIPSLSTLLFFLYLNTPERVYRKGPRVFAFSAQRSCRSSDRPNLSRFLRHIRRAGRRRCDVRSFLFSLLLFVDLHVFAK